MPLSLGCTWVGALCGDLFWEIEIQFRLFEMIVNFKIKMALTEVKILFENQNKILKSEIFKTSEGLIRLLKEMASARNYFLQTTR